MPRSQKILVVDSDETGLFLAKQVLKRASALAQVQTAANGAEAIQVIRAACQQEHCSELILVEINMPVMDGFEFLATCQQALDFNGADLQIILVSTDKHYEQIAQAKKYPNVPYIEKPLTGQKLAPFLTGV